MREQDGILLFGSIYPRFFEGEDICSLSADSVYAEMLLLLKEFDGEKYEKHLPDNISFGFYEGELERLRALVGTVDEGWVPFFDGGQRIYCGYVDGEVASFCIVENMGVHRIGDCAFRIGGPGCVGTLPKHRDKGIGLTMVKHVTQILKDEGYDYSYIHYTGVAPWYEKLGYKTSVKWGRNGVIQSAPGRKCLDEITKWRDKSMNIRRATKQDMEGLNRLLRQVLSVHHNGRPDLFRGEGKKYTDEQLAELLSDEKAPIFVAVDAKDWVLGYAFCRYQEHVNDNVLTDFRSLYIDDLCVEETVRGQHVGKALYEYVLAFAKEQGFYNVTLNVWTCNEAAMRFYERMGMKPQKIGMEVIL